MYKRYAGNSGEVRRVGEPEPPRPAPPPPLAPPPPAGWMERLGGLLTRLGGDWDTGDLLLALVLYLLYKDSGDTDFLLILAGTFLL